jgi:spore coat protein U-like protein
MKKILMAVIAVALVAMAGVAAAATTQVQVNANIVGTCRFNSATTTINIGDLPIDASGNALGTSANGSTTFWCTRNAAFAITDDDGQYELSVNANRLASTTLGVTEYIPYSFTYTPIGGLGNGPGAANYITLNYTATVGATYSNNSPDVYSDTVVVTITP